MRYSFQSLRQHNLKSIFISSLYRLLWPPAVLVLIQYIFPESKFAKDNWHLYTFLIVEVFSLFVILTEDSITEIVLDQSKKRIEILCNHVRIAATDKNIVMQSLKNPAVNDFEDGLEYYSALENKCDCIITEDIGDFYFSKIEVLGSEVFFDKYLAKKKG